eukprot:TRINITY_DN708_c0_g1_i4.p1 TRINITY_DN708_c0_g1~~TRINITY_DN708_c0_g1_i4.p1  ORF type:complete len:856 (+),score=250.49 TRINITY_DN708_c0_g1_i4:70-2637(+)
MEGGRRLSNVRFGDEVEGESIHTPTSSGASSRKPSQLSEGDAPRRSSTLRFEDELEPSLLGKRQSTDGTERKPSVTFKDDSPMKKRASVQFDEGPRGDDNGPRRASVQFEEPNSPVHRKPSVQFEEATTDSNVPRKPSVQFATATDNVPRKPSVQFEATTTDSNVPQKPSVQFECDSDHAPAAKPSVQFEEAPSKSVEPEVRRASVSFEDTGRSVRFEVAHEPSGAGNGIHQHEGTAEHAAPPNGGSADQPATALLTKADAVYASLMKICNGALLTRDSLSAILKQDPLAAGILFRNLETSTDTITAAEWTEWFKTLHVKGGIAEAESHLNWIETHISAPPPQGPKVPAVDPAAQEELFAKVKAAFDEIDAKCSKDGEVSRDELLKVLKQERLGAKILFRELDTNADGGISLTEWNAWFQRLTARGGLEEAQTQLEWIEDRLKTCTDLPTPEEVPLSPGAARIAKDKEVMADLKKRVKDAFDEIDAKCSQDGEVSRDELLRVLKQERLGAKVLFRELDTNFDGGISLTEWNAWFDRLATKGGAKEAETRLEWIEDRLRTCADLPTPEEVPLGLNRIQSDTVKTDEFFAKVKTAFDEIDAKCSKDGEVSRDELLKVLKQERLGAKILFHELDTNADGGISLSEWNAWFQKLAAKGGLEEAETRLEWIEDRLKTCTDLPTPEEVPLSPGAARIAHDEAAVKNLKERAHAAFDEIDAKCSQDGEVSRDELLRVLRQERLGAKVLFRELDANSGGGISLSEWDAWFERLLVKGGVEEVETRNSDGGISLSEWDAWFERLLVKGGVEEVETRLEWIEDRLKTCGEVVVAQQDGGELRVSIGRRRQAEHVQALTFEGMQVC